MLGSPVVRFPLEFDIGLLRQHHRLLGKGSSVRRIVRRKGTGGEQLWLGTFHEGRYTRFFRKILCVSERGDGLTEYLQISYAMYIPEDVIQTKRKRYLRDDKPIHRPELLNDSDYDIITRYQGEYRGLVNSYGLAQNLANLDYVRWTMATSLLKTLAGKHQTSVMKEAKRLQGTLQTPED